MLEHGGPISSRAFTVSSRGASGLHRQRSHCLLQGGEAPVVPGDVERVELRGGLVQLLLEGVDVTAVTAVWTHFPDEAVHRYA